MKTINLGLQIVPKSKQEHSYHLVDTAIKVIKEAGVKHEITPFETIMEGPEDLLHKVARQAQKAVLEAGAEEIIVYYRIQIRKDADVTMAEKTQKYRK